VKEPLLAVRGPGRVRASIRILRAYLVKFLIRCFRTAVEPHLLASVNAGSEAKVTDDDLTITRTVTGK
jgi:hypothetical protein